VEDAPQCAELQHTDVQALSGFYKEMGHALAGLLVLGADQVDSAAEARLICIEHACHGVMHSLWTTRPRMARALLSNMHRTAAEMYGPPDASVHARVVDAMRLRQQQRGMLVAARQQLLASLDAIMQRRAEILDALRPTSQSDSDCFNVDKITAAARAAEDLQSSVMAEHRAVCMFMESFFVTVVQPVQLAQALLAAWPYPVDAGSLCKAIEDQENRTKCSEGLPRPPANCRGRSWPPPQTLRLASP